MSAMNMREICDRYQQKVNEKLSDARIADILGWSKATMSLIMNGNYANLDAKLQEAQDKLLGSSVETDVVAGDFHEITVKTDVIVATPDFNAVYGLCNGLMDPKSSLTASIGMVTGVAGRGKLMPSYEKRTILDILDGLVKAGAIKRDGFTDKRETIFRLITDSKVRPVALSEKKKGKVDVIWEIIKSFGGTYWTTTLIMADVRWKDCGASKRYLDELLRQWRGEGIVEEVDADTRSRREPRRYRTLYDGERQIVLTHYGRK